MGNSIKKMRENTWRGVTDQNGNNPHFYRIYDWEGRVVAGKEGIVTIPAELAPRERHVKRDISGYVPKVDDKSGLKAFMNDNIVAD